MLILFYGFKDCLYHLRVPLFLKHKNFSLYITCTLIAEYLGLSHWTSSVLFRVKQPTNWQRTGVRSMLS